jgi:aspartate kinase
MPVKVAKFGGSSLADAKQFEKVRKIILADENRRYIIPSAPGKRNPEDNKVTDLLYLCHTQIQHKVPFDDVFNIICQRYFEIVKNLNLSLNLQPYLSHIKCKITEGASIDYIASRGEYLNGIILAELLGVEFIDSKEVIRFYYDGSLDLKNTKYFMNKILSKHFKAVIPGFYGSTPDGEIKIFPRGGSDITGAVVAYSMNAEIYENWTDVSGFLMADPNIVDNPKPIEKITYRELRELSYMGAKVLHEDTIFPVLEAGIPIHIKNTNDPEHPGTIIVSYAEPIAHTGTITGIAGKKNFTVIAIEKHLMKSDFHFFKKLFSILENYDICFDHLPSGIDTLSIVITDSQLDGKLENLMDEIQLQCNPDLIEVYPNMALIATVGHGMAYTPGMAARLFTALAKAEVNVRMIDQGSSEINIIVGIETDDFEKAVRAIYYAFQ